MVVVVRGGEVVVVGDTEAPPPGEPLFGDTVTYAKYGRALVDHGRIPYRDFYDEYLAVMDLTAEFYLQTVDMVFVKHQLPKGEMMHREFPVDLSAILRECAQAAGRVPDLNIKADISDNLSYGDLTLPAVAARLKLTPRHIQRLFESAGSTFSEFVVGQRLARAGRLDRPQVFADLDSQHQAVDIAR